MGRMPKNGKNQFWVGIAITVGLALAGTLFNLYGRLVEQETKIINLEKQVSEQQQWLDELVMNMW